MFNEERKEQLITKLVELLGPSCVTEWCANASSFTGELLRATDTQPPKDLEANIALNCAFTEVIKKFYGVDPEIMELEMHKCYKQLENIVNDISDHYKQQEEETSPEFDQKMSEITSMLGSVVEGIQQAEDGMDFLKNGSSPSPFPTVSVRGPLVDTIAEEVPCDATEDVVVEEKPPVSPHVRDLAFEP